MTKIEAKVNRGDRVLHRNTGQMGTVVYHTAQTFHSDGRHTVSGYVVVDLDRSGRGTVYQEWLDRVES